MMRLNAGQLLNSSALWLRLLELQVKLTTLEQLVRHSDIAVAFRL